MFQQYVPETGTVLDLGAGNCEFSNAIHARRRVAVDLNPETKQFADPGVEVLPTSSTDLSALSEGSVDTVFSSNFFEHLPTGLVARFPTLFLAFTLVLIGVLLWSAGLVLDGIRKSRHEQARLNYLHFPAMGITGSDASSPVLTSSPLVDFEPAAEMPETIPGRQP